MPSTVALDVDGRPDAVPTARREVRAVLTSWGLDDVVADAELIVSELVANALIHVGGTAILALEREDDDVLLSVADDSTVPPLPRTSAAQGTTGRGLALVQALSKEWGVSVRTDGRPGKLVWARLVATPAFEGGAAWDDEAGVPDLDALLADWPDLPGPDEPATFEVTIGSAPTELLLAAKDHLDGLMRELTLAQAGAQTGQASGLPAELAEAIDSGLRAFADVRQQVRRQALTARAHGVDHVLLTVDVTADVITAGEQFLRALDAADAHARDARLLTLESPVEYRLLRRWYVQSLQAGARRVVDGGSAQPPPTWEDRLVEELRTLEARERANELSAKLQRVTATLATATTAERIAEIVVAEGMRSLGASGGLLLAHDADDGTARPLRMAGGDQPVMARYDLLPSRVPGPSTVAMRSGQPVWVETRDERDRRFPHLAIVQPEAEALVSLPLIVAGDVVGALRFSFATPRIFDAGERAYLLALAAQTAQAVSRATAFQRLRDLRDELQRLMSAPSVGAGPAGGGVGGWTSDADEASGVSPIDLAVLRTLYEDAPVGVVVLDPHGHYLRVNRAIAGGHGGAGIPEAEFIGRSLEDILANSAPVVRDQLDRVLATGAPIIDDHTEIVGRSGVVHTWRTSWFPVRSHAGAVEAVIVVATDVSEARELEAQRHRASWRTRILARSGERLAAASSAADVLRVISDLVVSDLGDWCAVHLVDDHGVIRCELVHHEDPSLQQRLAAVVQGFQVTVDQPYGAGRVVATGHTQLTEATPDVIDAIAAGDQDLVRIMRQVGVRTAVIVPLVARGRTIGALSVGRRTAEQLPPWDVALLEDLGRRAGLALDNAQALAQSVRLELALEAAELGSYEVRVQSGEVLWDERIYRIFRVLPGEFGGTLDDTMALIVPEDRPRAQAAVNHAITSCGELAVDYRIRWPDGTVRWISSRGRALPGADGRAERLFGTVADTTDQREGRDRVVRALELMGDAFFSLDRDGRFSYVNREGERILGQTREELLGRDLWTVFPEAVESEFETRYRDALRTGRALRFEQHFRSLGGHFEVRAYPTGEGLSVYFTDIGRQRATELERDRALARLDLLDSVGEALAGTLDVDEALQRLADCLLPDLADLVTIDLLPVPDLGVRPAVVVTGSHPERREAMRTADTLLPRRDNPASAVHAVLSGAPPLLLPEVGRDYLASVTHDGAQLAQWEAADIRSAIVVPLTGRGRIFGAISLLRTGPETVPYGEPDRALATEIGRRAGLIIDNAVQYSAARAVAETLQRNLLPELPEVPGFALAAAYEPSSSQAKVGGDWYDAFPLSDGTLGIVIGDVMGHDIAAAAAMGQLRSVLRTCAAGGDDPATVLDRLDRLVDSFAMADLATVVYARLHRLPDGSGELALANAGHPPPLLLLPDGRIERLDRGASAIIGAPEGGPRGEARYLLPPGSLLVLYTDGVVERRDVDIERGIEGLALRVVELAGPDRAPARLCGGLIDASRRATAADDAAVLAVRLV